MRRLLLTAVLALGGWFLWNAYDTGLLVSPLKTAARTDADGAGRVRTPAPDAAAPEAAAPAPEGRRGRGGGRGGRGGGRDDGPVPVLVADARTEDVPVTVDAVGTIQALNTVTVRPQIDGRLLELTFKDGQDVKRGDVLARIDPKTYQAQFDQVVAKKAQDEATLANAKADLERYAKLATTQFGSRQQADTQKSTVAQLEAQIRADQGAIDNAQAVLDYTTIRSPIDGRTGIRLVDAGNIVHASDSTGIVVIAQLQPIAMVFNLPQQQLPAVNAALGKGTVAVQALESDNATVLDSGAVEVVDNQVDQTTGTVKIKARFPNAAHQLWPGQFVNVRLTVDVIRDAVVVPTGAVQRGPNGPYLYALADNGTVKLTNVTIGRQDEEKAIVQSGLAPPAQVVTTGFARLTDGAHVAVSPPNGIMPDAAAGGAPAAAGDASPGGEPRRRHRRAAPPDAGASAETSPTEAAGAAGSGEDAPRRHRRGQGASGASSPEAGSPETAAPPTGAPQATAGAPSPAAAASDETSAPAAGEDAPRRHRRGQGQPGAPPASPAAL